MLLNDLFKDLASSGNCKRHVVPDLKLEPNGKQFWNGFNVGTICVVNCFHQIIVSFILVNLISLMNKTCTL